MKQTVQTASGIDVPKEHWKALNEIDVVGWFLSVIEFFVKMHKIVKQLSCRCRFVFRVQGLGTRYQITLLDSQNRLIDGLIDRLR